PALGICRIRLSSIVCGTCRRCRRGNRRHCDLGHRRLVRGGPISRASCYRQECAMRQRERTNRARPIALARSETDRGSVYAAWFALTALSLIAAGHAWPAIIELLGRVG